MMHVKMMYRSVGLVKGRVFLLYLSKTSILVWERLDIMSGVIVISGGDGVVLSSISYIGLPFAQYRYKGTVGMRYDL